jgi:DHA1 family bicyclomycin/chloramphenicol resistance-like MFS transporter
MTPSTQHGPAHPHPSANWRFTLIIALMSTLAPFSIDTYLPSFPNIAADLHANMMQMQQTLSAYLVAFGCMMLAHGPLSDACGRKPVILGALVVYAATSIGCALAQSIETLVLLRAGQGLAAGAGLVIGRAMIRDLYAGAHAQRLMSNVTMTFAVAPAVAPIIGGWLHEAWGWRSVFWFLALLGAAVALLAWRRLPETLPPAGRQPVHLRPVASAYFQVLRNPRFMYLVAVLALNFGGMFLYIASVPVLLIDVLHFAPGDFGWFFVPVVSGIMLGAFLSGRLAGHMAPRRTITLGFILLATAAALNVLLAYLLAPSPLSAIAPIFLYATGMSLSAPSLTLLALDLYPQRRGLASAVQSASQTLFNALVAGTLSPLLSAHVASLALGMAGLLGVSFVIWVAGGRQGATAAPLTAANR